MAQDAVDAIAARPGVDAWAVPDDPPGARRGAGARHAASGRADPLVRRYGTEAADVLALGEDRPDLLQPLAEGVEVTGAELLFAVRHELRSPSTTCSTAAPGSGSSPLGGPPRCTPRAR